jgi:hypothetical protein
MWAKEKPVGEFNVDWLFPWGNLDALGREAHNFGSSPRHEITSFERCRRMISGSYKEGLMTVISTIITRRYTAHATDSLITPFGKHDKKDREFETKIIKVRRWRGTMSYWGLASTSTGWSTVEWLKGRVSKADEFKTPEMFAQALRNDLTKEFKKIRLRKPSETGLGIHLSVYERVEDYWIPELFKISNWTNNSYTDVWPDGFQLERVTYHTSFENEIDENPEDGEPHRRLKVRQKLQDGMVLIYNNGDPNMFNHAASAIFSMIQVRGALGHLKDMETPEAVCDLARRPIEIVTEVQRDFCRPEVVGVGGRARELAISPEGEYWSRTGDNRE